MEKGRKHKKLIIWMASVMAFLVLLTGVFYVYTLDYYKSTFPLDAMGSDSYIRIQKGEKSIVFTPISSEIKGGIVFYPGGKVEYSAYAPLMLSLVKNGYACVLVKMPFNLAVFDINAADSAMQQLPDVRDWLIGGHSLGGSMACAYAAEHADQLKGVILLASYSANDLSKTSLKVLSLYGSNDKVLNREDLQRTKAFMPAQTKYTEIPGGNHGQFGNYGEQKGDGTAEISWQEQQLFAVEEIVDYFK